MYVCPLNRDITYITDISYFSRRLEIRDHVMIMSQFLSSVLSANKKGVSANHDDNGNEKVAAVYRAEQWLNNICTNAN